MTKQTLKNIGLTLASSLLLIASWPPSSLNFLLFIAFVPVMIVIFEQKKVLHAVLYFYFSFQLFLLEMFFSLFTSEPYLVALILGLILVPIFWSIPFILSLFIQKKYGIAPALILFPFFYVCQEVAQYHWDFAMTWFHLGVGLSNSSYLLGIYPFLGQEGGTLLIVTANVCVYYLYLKFNQKQLKLFNAVPLVILILVVAGSNFIIPDTGKKETIKVAIFQPDKEKLEGIKDNLTGQIDLLESALKKSKFIESDLLICTESYFQDMKKYPLIVNSLEKHPAILRLMEISAKYQTPILSGATLVELFSSHKPPTLSAKLKEKGVYFDIYNGSIFITPNNKVSWRTKQKLVPFAESAPFYKLFNSLEKNNLWPSRYDKTYGTVAFDGPYNYGKLKIAPAICFESTFPHVISSYIKEKTNLITVLSTGWASSEKLQKQQEDGILINAKSFGKSIVFATLNQKSVITDDEGIKKFSTQQIDVQSIAINSNHTTYTYLSRYSWIWIFISIFMTIQLVILLEKNQPCKNSTPS